ncbi:type IV pili methyl-accepting chemotaxis transducer N-terminal domain-containing protein [Loktanella sp. S4079]|uniref:type IV pili methyl-accepting chemotaxis transducer N-terminal domain-containing protein n=1 Tax=Loktanella sp. S4079 TaxID=579483 RepID=UPI0005F9E10A|nr:type IV pili methyl-accepting chemotaxis transducer N-terminal domain-containing protein [Loktanella sp. S4079]KJZ21132.1 hypothetical protein TW80_00275 [Loktanella sp. S4079]
MNFSPLTLSAFVTSILSTSIPSAVSAGQTSTPAPDGLVLVEQTDIIIDMGAANRVIAADLLRTLSQEIPAATCYLYYGVDVDEARELLETSISKFDKALLALLNGDESMGIIGAEPLPRVVREIEELMATWSPIHDAAEAVLADPSNTDAVTLIFDSADVMLDKTYHLLSEIEAEYSNPVELLQSDMLLLEVSGRLAMMTQRMAYEACRIWSGDGTPELVADLVKTIGHFEAGMDALSNGLPELGIKPAPTPEIAAVLELISSDWSDIRGYLDSVIAGEELSVEVRESLYHLLAVKLHKVEELETLYQDYSKRVY